MRISAEQLRKIVCEEQQRMLSEGMKSAQLQQKVLIQLDEALEIIYNVANLTKDLGSTAYKVALRRTVEEIETLMAHVRSLYD